MAAEQGLDPEQGRSQLTPSRSRPYSAIWTVFSCIIVQALVGFGFQTRYFSQAQVDELKDQPERFLHWVSLTNSYALMATVVALALPYVRRGYHKMIILAVGILAAFSGGVMQASPPTVEQFAVGRDLVGTACALIVGMPFIAQADEADQERVRIRIMLGPIGAYCCAAAIATWMFVTGLTDFHAFNLFRSLDFFHALPSVLAFFFLLSPLKLQREAGDPSNGRGDHEKVIVQQNAPSEGSPDSAKQSRPLRKAVAFFCLFLYAFSMWAKYYQIIPFELDVFRLTTIGGLVRTGLCFVILSLSSALTIPIINKTGTAGMLFLSFVGQLLTTTTLRVIESKFLLDRPALPFAVMVYILVLSAVVGFGNGLIWLVVVRIDSHRVYLTGLYFATAVVHTTYAGLVFSAWYLKFLRGWPSVLVLANVITALIMFMFSSSLARLETGHGDRALEAEKGTVTRLDGVVVESRDSKPQ